MSRTSIHPAWIDARALEIAQGIAAEQKISDVQTIARIQLGAIEGMKRVLDTIPRASSLPPLAQQEDGHD